MWQVRGVDGSIATGWYLLPLRLFLGATFVFAGFQKLSNPNFFRNSSPISIHAQLIGTTHTSPIGGLLHHLTGASTLIGVVIAIAEVAIGVGALLGLLTRVAAVGGVLVSLSLFLAISFHTHPFYTGSDIVFVFAWTPLLLAGAAGAPALDTWFDTRQAPSEARDGSETAMSRGAFIAIVAAGTAVLVGVVAGIGRLFAPPPDNVTATLGGGSASATTVPVSTTTAPTGAGGASTTATTTATPKGTPIGPASDVPVGGSASFTDPTSGDPGLVIQRTADQFVAFDAICPHAGCTVAYQSGANIIACPCHGSEFNPRTGAVVNGPATSGLTPITVIKGSNGDLYVV
jgi:thiosulfate dehydrogenase [quinone] large subunit